MRLDMKSLEGQINLANMVRGSLTVDDMFIGSTAAMGSNRLGNFREAVATFAFKQLGYCAFGIKAALSQTSVLFEKMLGATEIYEVIHPDGRVRILIGVMHMLGSTINDPQEHFASMTLIGEEEYDGVERYEEEEVLYDRLG